jgi:large subunit ribosomal protein L18
MNKKPKTIRFRRKRQGKTNYKKRLNLLLSGKPRLVVRPSLKGITVQIISAEKIGDKVLAASHSNELKKLGWKFNTGNTPSAYLTGLLTAKKAVKKGIKEAILDIGLRKPVKGGRIFATLKGTVDAGLKVPFSDSILPSEERIKGDHIAKHLDKKDMPKSFEDIKNKILKE